jgi:hypothetical protein
VTKKWIVAQPKRREPMLIQPVTNLDYDNSKSCEDEYFRRRLFVKPGGDELPKKRNKVGENRRIAYGLTEKQSPI